MNNEEAFLSSTIREFIKCWRSGTKARVIIESLNGHPFINFSAFLGNPDDAHAKPRPAKRKPSEGPRKKSAKKVQRDNDRAARYQERKRMEGAASPSDIQKSAMDDPQAAETSTPGTESAMTVSGLEFSFASPVPETLRQDSSHDINQSSLNISHNEDDCRETTEPSLVLLEDKDTAYEETESPGLNSDDDTATIPIPYRPQGDEDTQASDQGSRSLITEMPDDAAEVSMTSIETPDDVADGSTISTKMPDEAAEDHASPIFIPTLGWIDPLTGCKMPWSYRGPV